MHIFEDTIPPETVDMIYVDQETNFFSVATSKQYSIQEFTQINQPLFSEPVTADTIIPCGVFLRKVPSNAN